MSKGQLSTDAKKREILLRIILFCALSLPWLPYFVFSVAKQIMVFPTYGEDQTHYLGRLSGIWQGYGPRFSFTPFGRDDFLIIDGFNTVLETIFFSLGDFFNGNRTVFILYLFFLISFSIHIAMRTVVGMFDSIFCYFIQGKLLTFGAAIAFIQLSFLLSKLGIKFSHIPESVRFPVPIIHFIFVCVLLKACILKTANRLRFGILVGVSSYVYFYTWVLSLIILALFCIYLSVYTRSYLASIKVFLMSLLTSSPTIIALLDHKLNVSDVDRVIQFAFGLRHSREPQWSTALTILLISTIMSYHFQRNNNNFHRFFKLNLIVFFTSVVCFNQQMITGTVLQIGHFHWYFIYPFTFAFCFVWLCFFVKTISRRVFTVGVIVMLFTSLTISFSSAVNSHIYLKSDSVTSTLSDYRKLDSTLNSKNSRVLVFDEALERIMVSNPGPHLIWHKFGIHYQQGVSDIFRVNALIWMIKNHRNDLVIESILETCSSRMDFDCYSFFSLLGSQSKLSRESFEAAWAQGELDRGDLNNVVLRSIDATSQFFFSGQVYSWLKKHDLEYILIRSEEKLDLTSSFSIKNSTCASVNERYVICSLSETLSHILSSKNFNK